MRFRTHLTAFAVSAALVWPLASSADSPKDKALRGLAGMTTGFLEIPGNIIETGENEGPVRAWTEGLVRGLGMSIVRPAVGVYELVTAPVPAPSGYRPILQPEYPWSYFGTGDEDYERPVAYR